MASSSSDCDVLLAISLTGRELDSTHMTCCDRCMRHSDIWEQRVGPVVVPDSPVSPWELFSRGTVTRMRMASGNLEEWLVVMIRTVILVACTSRARTSRILMVTLLILIGRYLPVEIKVIWNYFGKHSLCGSQLYVQKSICFGFLG